MNYTDENTFVDVPLNNEKEPIFPIEKPVLKRYKQNYWEESALNKLDSEIEKHLLEDPLNLNLPHLPRSKSIALPNEQDNGIELSLIHPDKIPPLSSAITNDDLDVEHSNVYVSHLVARQMETFGWKFTSCRRPDTYLRKELIDELCEPEKCCVEPDADNADKNNLTFGNSK
jgi:hypothetical protein